MADELDARKRELDEERRRRRDATMRFGEALAATHDPSALLLVFVETAVASTGASGGVFVGEQDEIVRTGDPDAGARRLEAPVKAGDETFGTLILSGEEFTQDQEETANWLAGHAAIGAGERPLAPSRGSSRPSSTVSPAWPTVVPARTR